MRRHRSAWGYRANVAARALAGTLGAYGVASLLAVATARLWPAGRIEAIVPGTLLAFAVMPAVTLWAFLARSPMRAWAGLLAMAVPLAGAAWWGGQPAA